MRRRKSTIFFVVFGICLIAFAIALNVGWILLNLQQIVLLVLGIFFFASIITGLVLNTTFLVREIRRNEQQDAFLNAMTHELKTPIASIKLYLETLKTRDVEEKKQLEFYDVMLADSDRLLHTVEQVLQASRSREKKNNSNYKQFELADVVRDCTDIVRTRYKFEDDEVEVASFPDDVKVLGDEAELKTAILNILDNAVKYSGEDISVKVRGRVRTGNWIEILISDKGIGFAENEASQVFKRFYRVESTESKARKGTGLGLFIVQNIIKKHGGKVFAKSKGAGTGSTFILRLPIALSE